MINVWTVYTTAKAVTDTLDLNKKGHYVLICFLGDVFAKKVVDKISPNNV